MYLDNAIEQLLASFPSLLHLVLFGMTEFYGPLVASSTLESYIVMLCPNIYGPLPADWSIPGALPSLSTVAIANITGAAEDFSFWANFGSASGAAPSLVLLHLDYEMVAPSTLDDIYKLPQLEYLHIANTQLLGAIPDTISSLHYLYHLVLQNCSLTDRLPATIDSWPLYQGVGAYFT